MLNVLQEIHEESPWHKSKDKELVQEESILVAKNLSRS